MFGLEDELKEEIEKLKKENDSLKEYSIWLSDLATKYHRMRYKVFSKEYQGDYKKLKEEVLFKFPVIQGIVQQRQIKDIGNIKKELDQNKLRNAIKILLKR